MIRISDATERGVLSGYQTSQNAAYDQDIRRHRTQRMIRISDATECGVLSGYQTSQNAAYDQGIRRSRTRRMIWVSDVIDTFFFRGDLFVLRFYGPVNPVGSCRARSVYLTTRLLSRLSPLSG